MFKRRLLILAVLAASLMALSSSRNRQMTEDCITGTDALGNCVMICCDPGFGCVRTMCP